MGFRVIIIDIFGPKQSNLSELSTCSLTCKVMSVYRTDYVTCSWNWTPLLGYTVTSNQNITLSSFEYIVIIIIEKETIQTAVGPGKVGG